MNSIHSSQGFMNFMMQASLLKQINRDADAQDDAADASEIYSDADEALDAQDRRLARLEAILDALEDR